MTFLESEASKVLAFYQPLTVDSRGRVGKAESVSRAIVCDIDSVFFESRHCIVPVPLCRCNYRLVWGRVLAAVTTLSHLTHNN